MGLTSRLLLAAALVGVAAAAALAQTPTPLPCTQDADCPGGLVCNSRDGVCCNLHRCPAGEFCNIFTHEGVCSVPNNVNAPCRVIADCASGLECVFDASMNETLCEAPPVATPTFLPTPTPTPVLAPDIQITKVSSGCAIVGRDAASGVWSLAAVFLLLWHRRRRL